MLTIRMLLPVQSIFEVFFHILDPHNLPLYCVPYLIVKSSTIRSVVSTNIFPPDEVSVTENRTIAMLLVTRDVSLNPKYLNANPLFSYVVTLTFISYYTCLLSTKRQYKVVSTILFIYLCFGSVQIK